MAYRLSRLDNGVTIITDTMPGFRNASVGIWIRAGSRDEPAELGGISHFVEHAVYRGSRKRHGDDIIAGMERLGANVDAETSRDDTFYRIDVAGENVGEALPILLDMVVNPAFRARDIAHERKVIIQELYQNAGEFTDLRRDSLYEMSFGRNGFSRPICGTIAKVMNMSRDNIAAWHDQKYRGSSIVVSAAGNVRHADIVDMAKRELGHLPKGRRTLRHPMKFRNAIHWLDVQSGSTDCTIFLPVPANDYRQFFLGELYEHYLGTGLSSRIYKRLCIDNGTSYVAQALHSDFCKESFMECVFDGPSDRNIVDNVRIVLEEISRAPKAISKESLDRAINLQLTSIHSIFDNPQDRARQNAETYLHKGRVLTRNLAEKTTRSIRLDEIRDYASRLVKQRLVSVVCSGPASARKHFSKVEALINAF